MTTTGTPIKNALAYLVATFRAEVDSYQVRAYERVLREIPGDVVMDAAEDLINQAAGGRKYYPMPTATEWKEACSKIIQKRRKAAFEIGASGCTHPSYLEEYQDERGVWWSRRCACYERGKKLMLAAGTPIAIESYYESSTE